MAKAIKTKMNKKIEPPSRKLRTKTKLLCEEYNIKGLPFTEENVKITPVFIKRRDKIYPLIFEYKSFCSHFSHFLQDPYEYISIYGKKYDTVCEICNLKYKCITDNKQIKCGCKEFIMQKIMLEKEEKALNPNLTDLQVGHRATERFEGGFTKNGN